MPDIFAKLPQMNRDAIGSTGPGPPESVAQMPAPDTFLMAPWAWRSCALPTLINLNFKQQIRFHGLAALVARALLGKSCASRTRAQGMPGARCTRGLVCNKNKSKSAHEHTGSAETLRHSLRNGFTAYFALSPAIQAFLT
ncbi:hypothetical protein, partial [Bradyrhizobium sp.]|uniref:hypothetical protein n=1 Tax=Bradyrhizobium sp. TaxID=376 RepID=UPI003C508742